MKLKMLKGEYVVVKLPFDFQIPKQILKFDFYNLSRTSDELSLVIRNDENFDYKKFEYEDNWSIFRFDSLLDFSLIGVLDGVIKPLSEKNISVFVLSTFDTDYVMFKTENKFKVISILENLEYKFVS
ncbi:MAG: ACT domain-containing protein [SAR202 cluster bacterium]|nr:ACT domain-containing protein [SAR202 cluster bacterium]|tara:strand:+ start:920 stop:1300 length:381 start_codon:yes stop_codon:yes gene_type:complete